MGDVFLAVQSGPGQFAKLVVQKRVRKGVFDPGRDFLAEARLLARVSHPNLLQVLDVDWDERGPFVVVEYLAGETLTALLAELGAGGRQVPWPIALRVMTGVAAGLAAAHGACDLDGQPDPILHRDLTPSNVMVCYSGAAVIIDFGIAKLAAASGDTRTGAVKGKLAYLAPELLRGASASPRSDLFQLGALFFELLTGRRLFDAPTEAGRAAAVLNRPIPPPGRLRELPSAVDRILLRLLARDPAERTVSADELCAQLEEVMRRRGAHVSEHEVGAWLKIALPRQHAACLRRERSCLRLVAPDPSATIAWADTRRRRRRRFAAASALAGVLGLAAGVSIESCAAGEAHPAAAPAAREPPPPVTPLVTPLPDEPAEDGGPPPERRLRKRRSSGAPPARPEPAPGRARR
jgi:eukaryotic-like serine/threonine-protein kinase